jgi:hypothetical protein
MAPNSAAADEEGLDAHRPALAGEREQIGVAELSAWIAWLP